MNVVTLEGKECAKAKHRPPAKDRHREATDLPPEDDMRNDLDEGEFIDAPSSRRGESAKEESEPNGGDAPDAKNIRNTCMMSEGDRKDRTHEMRGFVDETRYVVYTSKKLDQMTVSWRGRGRGPSCRIAKRKLGN